MENGSDFLMFLGRFHPIVVHLPIGFLILAALIKGLTYKDKFKALIPYLPLFWLLGGVSSVLTVILGYLLSFSGGYDEDTLFWHQWIGIGVTIFAFICYYSSKKYSGWTKTNSVLALVMVILITITGHFGGNLTHGSTYLVEYAPNPIRNLAGFPDKKVPRKKVTEIDSADIFLDLVSPMFDMRCVACHNPEKRKGKLDLSTHEAILRGGKTDFSVTPEDIEGSEIYRRITLPKTHKEFMPTEGKRPLSNKELSIIKWWIEVGAPAKGYVTRLDKNKEIIEVVKDYLGLKGNKVLSKSVTPPNMEAVKSLRESGIIINKLSKDRNFYDANFILKKDAISADDLASLLKLKEQIIWLNVSHSDVTDENLKEIGQLENLIKLNLSRNKISDDGLMHLEKLKNLESLNLYNTEVSKELLRIIPKLIHLKRLYISESNATNDIVSQLQKENRKLKIIFDKL